jgi:transcriptional regulator with XRE-family HTH domain
VTDPLPEDEEEARRLFVSFGKAIRAARRRRRMTQQHLAKLTGFGQDYISRIERGERRPGMAAMIAIARAVGLVVRLSTHRRNSKTNILRGDR